MVGVVGADVLGGPQSKPNENIVFSDCGACRPAVRFSQVGYIRGAGVFEKGPALNAIGAGVDGAWCLVRLPHGLRADYPQIPHDRDPARPAGEWHVRERDEPLGVLLRRIGRQERRWAGVQRLRLAGRKEVLFAKTQLIVITE